MIKHTILLRPPILAAIVASIPTLLLLLVGLREVLVPGDAQAGLVVLFLPFYAIAVFFTFFGLAWSIIQILSVGIDCRKILMKGESVVGNCSRLVPAVGVFLVTVALIVFVAGKIGELRMAGSAQSTVGDLVVLYEHAKAPYDHSTMMRLADNPIAPPEILEQLAIDRHVSVRSRVAANPNTPASVLEELAGDSEWVVRSWVTRNASTSSETLLMLQSDVNPQVRENARYYADMRESGK